MLCKILTANGQDWHVLFSYSASQLPLCPALWEEHHHLHSNYTIYLVIGDINQLDKYDDKLGGSSIIRGWEYIVAWKHLLNLQDVPFYGPCYTWMNNREDHGLIMERLDRAYGRLIGWMLTLLRW